VKAVRALAICVSVAAFGAAAVATAVPAGGAPPVAAPVAAAAAPRGVRPRKVEGFPSDVKARIRASRPESTKGGPRKGPGIHGPTEFVFLRTSRWRPGSTVSVAFHGGSKELRGRIADAAHKWIALGLGITFRFKDAKGDFVEWHPSDTAYAADIRIAFTPDSGYWSLLGRDSTTPAIASPGQQSMNFDGFDAEMPDDWETTVLHEFGHALGFEHEHQSPIDGCDNEFIWDDEPHYHPTTDDYGQFVPDAAGRRPGVYRYLGGPPNRWDKARVDDNLRALKASSAFDISAFDAKSIMKYYFPAFMFRTRTASKCYTGAEATRISDVDAAGARGEYPDDAAGVDKVLNERLSLLKKVDGKQSKAVAKYLLDRRTEIEKDLHGAALIK
jgi:hypothetical protein